MYCTIEQARAAGAQGDDAAIAVAIVAARRAIDRYTADLFAPTPLAVVAAPAPNGLTLLPYRVRSVDSVRVVGAASDLPVGGYLVTSSELVGQIDAVHLGAGQRHDVLIVGAEPWNGGYRGLMSNVTGQVTVTGEFGHDAPPPEVVECAALLAAHLTTLSTGPGTPGSGPDTDDEGNVVRITVSATVRRAPTTGHELVDALLAGYVRQSVTFN